MHGRKRFILSLWLFVFICNASGSHASQADKIASLSPGMWYEIPNSKLADHKYDWSPDKFPGVFLGGIIKAWNSGAFDTRRNRLLIFGGGHTDYGGNEIYGFSFQDFQWRCLSDPSPKKYISEHISTKEEDQKPYYPDGLPVSRHTYNYIFYHPQWDGLVSVGYRAGFRSGTDWGNNVDYYSFPENRWHTNEKEAFPDKAHAKCSTVDPVTGHIWTYTMRASRKLWEYEPDKNTWTQRTPEKKDWGSWDEYMMVQVDPARKLCVILGHGTYLVYDISGYDTKGYVRLVAKSSSGPQAPVKTAHPTLCYDPVSSYMVSWLKGTNVFALNLDTHEWTEIKAKKGNRVTPTAPAQGGTNGRWCYVPLLNAFAVVNSTDQNVFIYKFYTNVKDSIGPVIEKVSAPEISKTKRIPLGIQATDNVGIIGWRIEEEEGVEREWTSEKPKYVMASKSGVCSFRIEAKDMEGNISTSPVVRVSVDADDQAPEIQRFQITSFQSNLTINITDFFAMDDVGVTGYCITESGKKPDPFDPNQWLPSPPKVHKAGGCGKIMLHAWVRDNEGNISLPFKKEVQVRLDHSKNAVLVGKYHKYKTISEAVKHVEEGSLIEVDAGEYPNDSVMVTKNNIRIRGVGGFAHLRGIGQLKNRKGLVIQAANNLFLEHLELSGARVKDKNGAGIRNDAGSLTVRSCYIHDNENGILVGKAKNAQILIENSFIEKNGRGKGYTHNIYIGESKQFIIRNCLVQNAHIGHNIKSRSQFNVIEYCAILELEGATSYAIDIPNGGITYIRGNIIHQGLKSENHTFISYKQIKKLKWNPGRQLFIMNNTFYNAYNKGQPYILKSGSDAGEIIFLNNAILDPSKNLRICNREGKEPIIIKTEFFYKDPGFTDYKKFDFRLTPSAKGLINQGVGYDQYLGNQEAPLYQYRSWQKPFKRIKDQTLDIGAYEYVPEN